MKICVCRKAAGRRIESFVVLAAVAVFATRMGAWEQVPASTQSKTTISTDQSANRPEGAASSHAPQQAESEIEPLIIRNATRRVVVDVVVTGPDGKPVKGLTERDFTVLEDRKPQSVRAFEEHAPEVDRSDLPPEPLGLPAHTFINLEAVPASGPPVVLLLDFLNTPLDAQLSAHRQIEQFLTSKPGSLQVAIFALREQLSMLQGFTTDRDRLLAVFRSKRGRPRTSAATEQILRAETTLDAFVEMGKLLAAVPGRKNLLWFSGAFEMMVLPQSADRQQGELDVGREAASPDSGNGLVVTAQNLFSSAGTGTGNEGSSSGFSSRIGNMTTLQDRLKKVATALAASQTAIYPVDVRGLTVETEFSASIAAPSQLTADRRGLQQTPGVPTTPGGSASNADSHNGFMQSLNATHEAMEEIADATGGRAFENSNGIAAAANEAVQTGSSYYTLVYAPSNLKFDGNLRAIHVKLDKPGYKLAYRSAYYAVDPAGAQGQPPDRDSLDAALLHGAPLAQGLVFKAEIESGGAPIPAPANSPLPVKLSVNASKRAKEDPGFLSGMVQPYRVRFAIATKQLEFTATENERRRSVLQIAVYAYASDGRKVSGTVQKLEASMPPAVFQRALEEGMFHSMEISVPVEAESMRLAIRDSVSHRVGSLEVALPLSPAQDTKGCAAVQP